MRGDVDVAGKRMKLIIEVGGRQENRIIPWTPDVRGPYGAEQSMARKPMKEHEKRPAQDLHARAEQGLPTCCSRPGRIEPVLLGDGKKRPLLARRSDTTVDGRRRPELDPGSTSTPRVRS